MSIKIIHLISSLSRGGRERQLCTIVDNSDKIEYPTYIIYFNESDDDYIKEYNLAPILYKVNPNKILARLKELNNFINYISPDIVYSWGTMESILILLLKPFHKFEFINGSIRHGILSKDLYHYLRTFVLHLSKNIVANSYAGLKANKLRRGEVLYNGIDSRFIQKVSPEEKSVKKKSILNINDGKIIFISVANLVPYKDYFTILNALKLIKEEGYDFHYLILGDGPLKKNIEAKAKELNIEEDISILGNVVNVIEYLQLADIFIHSSKGEGCSNAILEAMAAGLPIIASNTGGTPEIVTENNGFLFEYENVDNLQKNIKTLLSDKELIDDLGASSYHQIKEKFSTDYMMDEYKSIIKNIVGKNE